MHSTRNKPGSGSSMGGGPGAKLSIDTSPHLENDDMSPEWAKALPRSEIGATEDYTEDPALLEEGPLLTWKPPARVWRAEAPS